MKELLITIYCWFKFNFGNHGIANNKINNYYAGIPYVEKAVAAEDTNDTFIIE